MSKNNKLINNLRLIAERNRLDNIARAGDDLLPDVYAAIALTLHRDFGFGQARLTRLILASQDIWQEYVNSKTETGYKSMAEYCEAVTGVSVIKGLRGE